MIRVLIADDEALVRGGLRMILEAQADLAVVGEAVDGLEAVERCVELHPDVVLMDVRMPRLDGIAALRSLHERLGDPPRVLMLTTFNLDEYVYDALRAGATGFLLKSAPPAQLVEGVRSVADGRAPLAPEVTTRLIETFVKRPPAGVRPAPELDELTEREAEVLGLIAEGRSNAEIAGALVISEATVKSHVTRILMKLGVRDRVHAVILAYESGLVVPGSARP